MLLVEQNSFLVNSSSIPKERRYSVKSFLGSVVLIIIFTQLDPAAWKVDNAVYWINLHFVDRSLAKCQKTKQSPNIVEPTGCVRLRTFDWF